jgi:putative transposase
VEGGGGRSAAGLSGLLAVAAYIDLNPVRAGIVDDPKGYRWCSYAAAVAGEAAARRGLAACCGFGRRSKWRSVGAAYRKILFGAGEQRVGSVTPDGRTQARRGFTQAEIEAVWKAGGKLSLAQVLRCRVKYFTEGLALGSKAFLASYAGVQGSGGRGSAREVEGADLGGLLVFGPRKQDSIRAPG